MGLEDEPAAVVDGDRRIRLAHCRRPSSQIVGGQPEQVTEVFTGLIFERNGDNNTLTCDPQGLADGASCRVLVEMFEQMDEGDGVDGIGGKRQIGGVTTQGHHVEFAAACGRGEKLHGAG